MIKIKSKTNVITNSSSETFILKFQEGKTFREVKEEIMKFGKSVMYTCPSEIKWPDERYKNYDHGGGCGGFLQIYSWIDMYFSKKFDKWEESGNPEDYEEFKKFYTPEDWIKEHYPKGDYKSIIFVDLDDSRYATIKYLKSHFEVLLSEKDTHLPHVPEDKYEEFWACQDEKEILEEYGPELLKTWLCGRLYSAHGDHLEELRGDTPDSPWFEWRFFNLYEWMDEKKCHKFEDLFKKEQEELGYED